VASVTGAVDGAVEGSVTVDVGAGSVAATVVAGATTVAVVVVPGLSVAAVARLSGLPDEHADPARRQTSKAAAGDRIRRLWPAPTCPHGHLRNHYRARPVDSFVTVTTQGTTQGSTQAATRGRVHVQTGAKRVRVYLGGEVVADTTRPLLVWEIPYYPTYYVPVGDVRADALVPTGETKHSPSRGDGTVYTVKVGNGEAASAALRYPESPIEELRDAVRFEWDAMDAWFEEDEEVYFHPRSPQTRVDILPSSRTVRVEVDGVVLAESTHPHVLFETGLPPRWYLPKVDVRLDRLTATDTTTNCPYKGTANYWSARIGDRVVDDIAWWYRTPLPESERIAGLVCFYNERVDLFIDGELQERPKTKFS
jgi:uncharacterized protein (DUF427 family)